MAYPPDHPPTECSICKHPISVEQRPSVLLEDGEQQIHMESFARIEKLRLESPRRRNAGPAPVGD